LAAAAALCGAQAASAATTAYLTDGAKAGTLIPIDVSTRIAGAPIVIGTSAFVYGEGLSADGSTLYGTSSGKITKLDIATGATTTWTAGLPNGKLKDAVLTKDGKTLWTVDWDHGTVIPVDTVTGQAGTPIPVGAATSEPSAITLSAD